jgi:hypothetical protein
MKAIIYSEFLMNVNEICINLICKGIQLFEVTSLDKAEAILKRQNDINYIVTDTKSAFFIKKVKSINSHISIIGISPATAPDFSPEETANAGLVAVIKPGQDSGVIIDKLEKIITANAPSLEERRKSIRIRLVSNSSVTTSIHIQGEQHVIRGNILNLCTGGFAFNLFDINDLSYLKPGTIFNTVHITLRAETIKTGAAFVASNKELVCFAFVQLEQSNLKKIAAFIYGMMQEDLNTAKAQ